MNVIEYLNKKGIKYKRRGDEGVICCPFCGDTEWKGAINLSTGAYNCLHLNKCGVRCNFTEFQRKLGDKPENKKSIFYHETPKTYSKPKPIKEGLSVKVKEYLHGRGFNDDSIAYFKFNSLNDDVIQIPYYRQGKLVSIKYRSISDKSKMWTEKNTEPILFNRDNIEKDSLVICEGEYDAVALHQYGIEAVSVPMGAGNFQWIDTEWEYLDTFETIYLCFDNDTVGKASAKKAAVKIGEYKCKLVELPLKDANECLLKGIKPEIIIRAFGDAKDIKPDTLVDPGYFEKEVQELFAIGENLNGTPTPWAKLNNILKGWREGEVTVWSGQNGAGKSTMLNQVFIDLARKNIGTCIYSGEMPPPRYLRWAVMQYTKKQYPSPDDVHYCLTWMQDRVKILDMTSNVKPDKLLSDFEYAARRYGIKHFIIDSLMKITFSSVDEYKEQKRSEFNTDEWGGFLRNFCGGPNR